MHILCMLLLSHFLHNNFLCDLTFNFYTAAKFREDFYSRSLFSRFICNRENREIKFQ